MQQIMGAFESSYDFIQEENMREIIQLVVSFTGSLGFAALFNIHGKKLWFAALGGCLSWADISGSRVHNAKSVCVRFLVNSSYYFVCRMYGKNS